MGEHAIIHDSLEPRSIPKMSDRPLLISVKERNRLISLKDVKQETETDERVKEKARLRQLSKKMAETWTNSFEGRARQNIKNKKEREQKRNVQEAYEDILREQEAEKRQKYVLGQANKRLYERTDRVRRFHVEKNAAECYKEREKQLKMKEVAGMTFDRYDKAYINCIMRDVDNYHDEIDDKLKMQRKKNIETASAHLELSREVKNKYEQEKLNNFREGCIIRDEALREESNSADLTEKEKKLNYCKMLKEQMKIQDNLRMMQKKIADDEEAKDKLFNDAKVKMKMMQKEKQKEAYREKAKKEELLRIKLAEESLKAKTTEEANLIKAAKVINEKELKAASLKAQKLEEVKEDIEKYNKSAIELKKMQCLEERREAINRRRGLIEYAEELEAIEDAKRKKTQLLQKEALHGQLQQIENRRNQKRAEKWNDLSEYLTHVKDLNDEEDFFQNYAQMQIQECESRGIDTRAMKVVAQPGIECGRGPLFTDRGNIRPKYLPACGPPCELSYKKKMGKFLDTKSRLGFIS